MFFLSFIYFIFLSIHFLFFSRGFLPKFKTTDIFYSQEFSNSHSHLKA